MRIHQPVDVEVGSTSIQVRTPLASLPTVAGGIGFVLVALAMLVALRPVSFLSAVVGLGALVVGIGLILAGARARIVLTEDQLVHFGDFRQREVATNDVSEFYVDRTPHLLPWFSVWVRLESGEGRPLDQCRVFEIRSGPARERLEQAAKSMNDWLAEH